MSVILALETTERYGSLALLDETRLLVETTLPRDRRSSQTLATALDQAFEEAGIPPRDVALVAVITGPGSFTGLRVGVTTAKMFAWAVGADVLGLETHEVVAMGHTPASSRYLTVGVDAQRGELSVVTYDRADAEWYAPIDTAPKLISVADWWKLAEQYDDILFSGPALERWVDKAPGGIALAEESLWFPKASVAGRYAAEYLLDDRCFLDDCLTLLPVYSRPSAAEERRSAIGG